MYKRLSGLSFIVGLFFIITAIILVIDFFVGSYSDEEINLYTGIVFFIFGALIIIIKSSDKNN